MSIRCWDSNPQPSEYESLPITTRPGLPSAEGFLPHYFISKLGKRKNRAVVVAQLVERLLPIPEVRGSNRVIGKNLYIYIEHLLTVNCVLKGRK